MTLPHATRFSIVRAQDEEGEKEEGEEIEPEEEGENDEGLERDDANPDTGS